MNLKPGHLYFVKDEFFDFVNDPHLMKNYPQTKHPHYYAITDRKTGLFWLTPCSSRVEKYERIISRQKKERPRCHHDQDRNDRRSEVCAIAPGHVPYL